MQPAPVRADAEAFQIRQVGDIAVVTPMLPFEDIPAPMMDSSLSLILGAIDNTANMVVDVSRMRYLPSDFLALLIKCHKRIRQRGGELALAGVSATHREELHVTNLDTLWALYDDAEEALYAMDGD